MDAILMREFDALCLPPVQKWAHGQKQPSDSSLKLLDLVDRKGLDVLA
jgi:DNA-binding transcriptional regulator YiaG